MWVESTIVHHAQDLHNTQNIVLFYQLRYEPNAHYADYHEP